LERSTKPGKLETEQDISVSVLRYICV